MTLLLGQTSSGKMTLLLALAGELDPELKICLELTPPFPMMALAKEASKLILAVAEAPKPAASPCTGGSTSISQIRVGWTDAAMIAGARTVGISPFVVGSFPRKEAALVEIQLPSVMENQAGELSFLT